MAKSDPAGPKSPGLWVPVISAMFVLAANNYLLFHLAAEGFAITVAAMIYVLATRTYSYSGNNYLLFLAYAYFFVGILDFFHLIAYPGMNIFAGSDFDTGTQLWIAGRYLQACSLFAAPFFIGRIFSKNAVLCLYGLAAVLLIASIIWLGWFPSCYNGEQGLTGFKVFSEYLICLIILAAIIHLRIRRSGVSPKMYTIMVSAMVITIASEICFTLYADPYGIINFLGHILKVISYYLIYWGIVLQGIQSPYEKLTSAYDSTLEGWARAVELRDHATEGHCRRVTEMAMSLAHALGMGEKDLINIMRGALLHDIGKIGIPDSVLLKPGPLDLEEKEIIEKHPEYGYRMLSGIDYLRPALEIVYCHHEKWDGTGYPRGLKENEIPLPAQLFALIDVWDALTSDRPYRPAWSREKALDYVQEQAGRQFSPEVVEAFLQHIAWQSTG